MGDHPGDGAVQQHLVAGLLHVLGHALGNAHIAVARIHEFLDQADHAVARLEQGVGDNPPDGQALAALGHPVGRQLVAGAAPDLLAVLLEEHLIQFGAELRRVGVLHVLDLPRGDDLADRFAQEREARHQHRHRVRLLQDVGELHRVIVEDAAVVNAADPLHHHDLAFHQSAKPAVQVFVLGEPAVAAEVELEPLDLDRVAQPADEIVAVQHRGLDAICAQFMSDGESGRAGAQNHHVLAALHVSSRLRHNMIHFRTTLSRPCTARA